MTTILVDKPWTIDRASRSDIEAVVAFNARVFRPPVGVWARQLLEGRRPGTSTDHFVLARKRGSGAIVSSLCALFQEWRYEQVVLRVGQLELVGTDPDWRRQGLVRAQMATFDQILSEQDCVLSCVQGIPGVYQRLGYQYAVPFRGGMQLECSQIPDAAAPEYRARRCEDADYQVLSNWYDTNMQSLRVTSLRDQSLWRYQETQPAGSEHAYETFVIDHENTPVGYIRFPVHAKPGALPVRELAIESHEAFLFALGLARDRALASGSTGLVLQIPPTQLAYRAARYLGGRGVTPFAWQIRVLNWPRLFAAVAPVLDARLQASLLAQWSGKLTAHLVDLGTLQVSVERGHVGEVRLHDQRTRVDVETTSGLFCQLLMGYRSADALAACYPELRVEPGSQLLVDTLFPARPSFVYEAY